MTLQEIFILNLKKFRKKRGISQMALAELSDTTGNYIGQIEMGRRIPSFDTIERIAAALRISSYKLFSMEEPDEDAAETEPTTKDYLLELPRSVREEMKSHLLSAIHKDIDESFKAKNY
jgi:transcriptional regulator with XRE-family HTH domain